MKNSVDIVVNTPYIKLRPKDMIQMRMLQPNLEWAYCREDADICSPVAASPRAFGVWEFWPQRSWSVQTLVLEVIREYRSGLEGCWSHLQHPAVRGSLGRNRALCLFPATTSQTLSGSTKKDGSSHEQICNHRVCPMMIFCGLSST